MAPLIRHTSRTLGWSIALGVASVLVTLAGVRTVAAHKPVTSAYDYNRDVFPLLRDNCGGCHVEGGVAPMSLMTYKEAVPWAESIRDELTAGRMPPWPMDPRSPAVKGMHPISAHDVDVIVTWAAGGTPRDWSVNKQLPNVTLHNQWKLGQPDLVVSMVSQYTLGANAVEATKDFSIPSGITEVKWVRAVDLLPETPTIVRDAIIGIENGPTLALWQPGSDPLAAPSGAAFRIAPGAKLHLQIHYKKHYTQEQDALSDKSSIGLYFTDPPASGRELKSVSTSEKAAGGESSGVQILKATLPSAGRVYALRPMLDKAYGIVDIVAITPSGKQISLLKLRGPRPQWFRRYWLQKATELANGSAIEARFTPLDDDSDEMKASVGRFPLQVAVDYVPQ